MKRDSLNGSAISTYPFMKQITFLKEECTMEQRDKDYYDKTRKLIGLLSDLLGEPYEVARIDLISEALVITKSLYHSYGALSIENALLRCKTKTES